MRVIVFLFFFLSVTSCSYFEKKKVYSEDLLEEELQTFNWSEVDTYPTFEICDSSTTKLDRKVCFQNTLVSSVNTYLATQKIIVSKDVNDTIKIDIRIDSKGLLTVESIVVKPETTKQIPKIESLLKQSLKTIPKLYPAIKRGQQVKTAFQLPVIVKIE